MGENGYKFVLCPFCKKNCRKYSPLKRESATIIDLGTGSGILSIELNKLLPQVKIIGIDPSNEMLEIARKNADEAEISNYETRLVLQMEAQPV